MAKSGIVFRIAIAWIKTTQKEMKQKKKKKMRIWGLSIYKATTISVDDKSDNLEKSPRVLF